MSDDKSDEDIYKVDTVPPPAGEDDAYSAPTRIGPMAAAVVEEMMVASVRKAAELNERAIEKAAAAKTKAEATAEPDPETALGDSDLIPESEPARPPPVPSSKPPQLPASKPPQLPASKPPQPVVTAPPLAETAPPRLYDEADDEENAPTMLSDSAVPPVAFPQVRVAALGPSTGTEPRAFAPAARPAPGSGAAAGRGGWSPPPVIPMPAALPAPLRSDASLYVVAAIGFALFAIGLTVFFWVR